MRDGARERRVRGGAILRRAGAGTETGTGRLPREVGMALLLIACAVVPALAVSVPNVFVNGTPADADAVNGNFSALEDAVTANEGRLDALDAAPALTCARRTGNGNVPPQASGFAVASCVGGEVLTGGGCNTLGGPGTDDRQLYNSYPSSPTQWRCAWHNRDAVDSIPVLAYAVCCS